MQTLSAKKNGKEMASHYPEATKFTISIHDEFSSEVDIDVYIYNNEDESAVLFTIKAPSHFYCSYRPLDWDLKTANFTKSEEDDE